jgi:hypothetical protein
MSDAEFVALVERLRVAQRRYFRERSQAALLAARDLEDRVDDELNRRRSPDLFDGTKDAGGGRGAD